MYPTKWGSISKGLGVLVVWALRILSEGPGLGFRVLVVSFCMLVSDLQPGSLGFFSI